MRLRRYFSTLVVAAAVAASPMIGLSQEDRPSIDSSANALAERTPETMTRQPAENFAPAESFEVAVSYCYLGSVFDESTGEILDLYGLCEVDSFEVA